MIIIFQINYHILHVQANTLVHKNVICMKRQFFSEIMIFTVSTGLVRLRLAYFDLKCEFSCITEFDHASDTNFIFVLKCRQHIYTGINKSAVNILKIIFYLCI
jgi:hypothetical protein